ncbi:hypothetical protein HELRODRAFT_113373 [Helobdella robusta]|uniref:Beta-lactamase-related domain-containing protein n=1 Tax=Helobdella robusta TaxID=6412 RepID=T1EFR9_HELRO|nr:hypothetical protein HELRODRAFT_113373 [Helobdella robusta]ESN99960.1 hypothetical protein HELRODRAFT_113373 [Helobdella robusta]
MKLLRNFRSVRKFIFLLNGGFNGRKIKKVAFCSAVCVGSIGGAFGLLYWQQFRSLQCAEPQIINDDLPHDEQTEQIAEDEKDDQGDQLNVRFKTAIRKSRTILQQLKTEKNCPGVTVAVAIDGQEVWKEGFGLSDVENNVQCTPNTVMRIASISKPLTMAVVAKLVEGGSLDLDEDIRTYVKDWPIKSFQGKESKITTRMLLSMLGGIRHYDKSCGVKKVVETEQVNQAAAGDSIFTEFYLAKNFSSVIESLDVFKDDQLCSEPGSTYLYSTHSFTLVSAVAEKVGSKKFQDLMKNMFRDLNLKSTYLDENIQIIHNRARCYFMHNGHLVNARYVDNSCKWAGGGLLSTPTDLCLFGSTMLACSQGEEKDSVTPNNLRPYLSKETMKMIWTPNPKTQKKTNTYYAMGWEVMNPLPQLCLFQSALSKYKNRRCVYHTGGAVGSSSILLIMPRDKLNDKKLSKNMRETVDKTKKENAVVGKIDTRPRGTVVAVLTNMENISMFNVAREIAALFESDLETQQRKRATRSSTAG